MERKYGSAEEALAVAKEAIWLAWQACGGTSGFGSFRDNPTANKEAVWDNAYNKGDYSGRGSLWEGQVSADYVFGRMMKFNFRIKGDTIDINDYELRSDYQAWCHKYKTFAKLFDAAEVAVRTEVTSEAEAI